MTKTAIIADFMVAFVSEFAKIYNLTETQAFRYLYRYGAIEDITNCYEAAHTLSFEDVCQTAADICKSRGGELAQECYNYIKLDMNIPINTQKSTYY